MNLNNTHILNHQHIDDENKDIFSFKDEDKQYAVVFMTDVYNETVGEYTPEIPEKFKGVPATEILDTLISLSGAKPPRRIKNN